MKTLIVYYSHGGNTGAAARRIAEQTGAPCAAFLMEKSHVRPSVGSA